MSDAAARTLRTDPHDLGGAGDRGVHSYHTTLERRAIAGATMSGGSLAMVVAATVMATAGLLHDGAAAVIGSMCMAPFIGPSRAVCIGALFQPGRGTPNVLRRSRHGWRSRRP